MNNRVTVLLASKSSFLRAYFRLVIEGRPRFQVIGEASSPASAVRLAEQKRPQIVVLGHSHDGNDFFESIWRINQDKRTACLIVGAGEHASSVLERARELGVGAVIMENEDPSDLIKRLEEIGG